MIAAATNGNFNLLTRFNFKVDDIISHYILRRIRKTGKKGLTKIGKISIFTGKRWFYCVLTAVAGLLSFQRQRYMQAYVLLFLNVEFCPMGYENE